MSDNLKAPSIIVKSRDSLLTTSSGYTNYRGILNLVIILLALSNARAALENVIKYGILVDPFSWLSFLGEGSKHWPALLIVASTSIHIVVAYLAELAIAWRHAPNYESLPTSKPLAALVGGNLIACIALPPAAIYANETHPISTSGALMIVSIVFLKLVSYHMMNFWCRDARLLDGKQPELVSRTTMAFLRHYSPPAVEFGLVSPPTPPSTASSSPMPPNSAAPTSKSQSSSPIKGAATLRRRASLRSNQHANGDAKSNNPKDNNNKSPSPAPNSAESPERQRKRETQMSVAREALSAYPSNLTLGNMIEFISFPTLNYEIQFARTARIRKHFLVKRLVEFIILSQVDIALVQQWIVPTVSNSVLPFRQMQLSHMLERLLKLAIPNHVIWLIWFYLFFHSLLNIQAELTRFADREFYRDWWNSESVYYFWSNWNIPVHKWCARHMYVPLMSLGWTKCQASTAVFFVSAFFHEYLVSVPLKMFRMWAFTGMLLQLPWARFVSSHFNNQFANVAVWVSLIIGQPLCILMYYHDYYVINHRASRRFSPAS